MDILLLEVASALYGIDRLCVRRVIDPRREPVQEEPQGRSARYRGEQYRLVDVRRDLEGDGGSAPDGSDRAYLLVDSSKEGAPLRYLLGIDGARATVKLQGERLYPIPPYIFAERTDCFRGVFEYRGRLQLLFNEQCL
jgi:hypothetical protein